VPLLNLQVALSPPTQQENPKFVSISALFIINFFNKFEIVKLSLIELFTKQKKRPPSELRHQRVEGKS
jgi:hypothetical protein